MGHSNKAIDNTPYTYRLVKNRFFGSDWAIYFEDTQIMEISNSSTNYVATLVKLFNIAWGVGWESGYAAGLAEYVQ